MRLAIAIASGLAMSAIHSQAQSASATSSGVQAGSDWDYTITLQNTGTTQLEGFWYAWTTGGNNLTLAASNPGSSLGWTDSNLTGATSISYQGGAGDALEIGRAHV